MARTPHMRASLLICKCTGLFSLDTMSHRGALRPVHLAQRKGYIPRLATPPPPLPSPIPAATPAPDNHHSILCLCELDCFRYFTLERSELRHWAEIIMDQQSQVCNALCHSVSPPNNTERWAWWPRRGLHDGPRPQPNEWWRQDWSPGSSNAQTEARHCAAFPTGMGREDAECPRGISSMQILLPENPGLPVC